MIFFFLKDIIENIRLKQIACFSCGVWQPCVNGACEDLCGLFSDDDF